MLNSIKESAKYFHIFADYTINNPNFLGRAISWGVFYGSFYLLVKRIYILAKPKISNLFKPKPEQPKERSVKKENPTESVVKIIKVIKQVICEQCQKKLHEEQTSIHQPDEPNEKEEEPINSAPEPKKSEEPKADEIPKIEIAPLNSNEDDPKKKNSYWPFQ